MKGIFLLLLLLQLSLQAISKSRSHVKKERGLSLRKQSRKDKDRTLFWNLFKFNGNQNRPQQNNNNNWNHRNRFIDRTRTNVKSMVPSQRYRPKLHYPTEAVISNYDNMMLQINMQRSTRFNTSSTNADYFVHQGGVYGFEWKNGMFIRQPFPTFQRVSDEFIDRINGTALFVPLHNRYQPRKPMISQMDCALHMKVIEHTHFLHRFNRIILQFSSPCRSDPLELVLLNRAGLRKMLRLKIGPREFLINFRGVFKGNYVTNLEKESYSEYRLASPQHLYVNNLRKKYLNDFRNPIPGEKITPEVMMTNNEAILTDMEAYYQRNEELLKSLESGKEIDLPEQGIEQNTRRPLSNDGEPGAKKNKNDKDSESTTQNASQIEADRKRREQEAQESIWRWGMNYHEIGEIQSFFNELRKQSKEVLNMCKNICTQDSYYPSWDFCKETCNIDQYFLSNDDSWEKEIQYMHNVDWSKLNGKYLRLSTGKRKEPYWNIEDIQRIWNSPPVITCRQTWTALNCSI